MGIRKKNPEIPIQWVSKELGELFEFKNGLNAGKESYGNGVKFINVMEVIYHHQITSQSIPGSVVVSKKQHEDFAVLRGDVLFNRTSEITNEVGLSSVYLDDEKVVFGGFVIRGRPKKNDLNDDFKKYCFRSQSVREQIIRGGQGVVRSNIGQGDLEKVTVLLPPLPEQKAIASVLNLVDLAIDKTNQLIAKKELQKKGLMQQLLTGKKRLTGFQKKWLDVKLHEVFERVTRKNTEANTNVVTISAQNGFINQTDYFNKIVASDILDNYFLVEKGEFCYNKSYSNGYPWGATKRLNGFEKAVVTTLYICFRLRTNSERSGDFFEQFFEFGALEKGLMQIAHEGGRAHGLLNVTPSDFFNLSILIPPAEEQRAIAKILLAADREIQLLKNKAGKLREQKKGMMQVLLTGKKRLRIEV